jgi:NADPH2:quinone reductase
MRAIRVHETGGPEVLRVDDIPDPIPGAGELLIDVEAVGVNFIEIYQREGLYVLPRPFTPGTEAAGVVRALGSGVTDFKVGDRVVSQSVKGAYAERAVVAAERAIRIPDGVTTKQAAAVWLQGLTAHYLTASTFPLDPTHSLLVHAAAGGVGLLLCQMAKKRGAFVIGTASTDAKRQLAREAGADEMIDYTTQDFAAETRRITRKAGVCACPTADSAAMSADAISGAARCERFLSCMVPPFPRPESIASHRCIQIPSGLRGSSPRCRTASTRP